jgi:hypothetical protein
LIVVVGGSIHCWLLGVFYNSNCPLQYMLVHANVLPGSTFSLYDVAGSSFCSYIFKPQFHMYYGSLSLLHSSPLLFGGANHF